MEVSNGNHRLNKS